MKIVKRILSVILPLLIIFSIAIVITDISPNISFLDSVSFLKSNSFVWAILLVFLCFITDYVLKIEDKRLIISSIILATVLSLMSVIGDVINTYLDLSIVITNKNLILYYCIKLIGTIALIYIGTVSMYTWINKKITATTEENEWKIFNATKKNVFIYWAIIFVAYIPYLLTYYPGAITSDSLSQISQGVGIEQISNHHPFFHTTIISIFLKIGGVIGNYNIGVALYSVVQMLALSGIFAYTIYYMNKKRIPMPLRITTLVFYALYPVHAMYSITMWKDIPFAISMLLFVIFINELVTNKEQFFKSKKNLLLFAITMLLVILFRNNGIYVIILTAPFIFLFAKKYYKQLIIVFVGVLLIYSVLWKGLVFNILNVQEGSIVEALSVPLQQVARVVRDKSDELTDEEKTQIRKFWPIDNLGEIYDPKLSDNVKWSMDSKVFSENKGEFIKLWIGLFVKYPGIYIESFLCNSYGYWYPEASNWVVSREIAEPKTEEQQELGLKQTPVIDSSLVKNIDSYIEKRNIPIISMFFSVGFAMWLVFAQIAYIIYRKQYKLLLIFAPILFLWLTNLASPVFCEFRYIYSLFTCLPILLFVTLPKNENKERKESA